MDRTDTRTFLGFEGGFVALVARTLLAEHKQALAQIVVVLPGRRAGRKLLEELLLQAGAAIEPPRIVTEAGLAQALSALELNLASPAAVEWAWFDALARASASELAAFRPSQTSADTLGLRIALARQLAALDRERAADEGAGKRSAAVRETLSRPRLASLAALSARASESLERSGRIDPARAIRSVLAPQTRRAGVQLVLAGMTEISPALRALLETLTPKPRVLIQANADCAAGFDEFGALLCEFWEQRPIPLRDDDWCAVEDPAEAVQASLAWVARIPEGATTDELALGVLSETLLPRLVHAFAEQGQPLHAAGGERVQASAPWLALEALHAWLARKDFSALAAALRHPDIEACVRVDGALGDGTALIAQLDAWHAEHLPDSLHGKIPGADSERAVVSGIRDKLRELLGELGQEDSRPLFEWTDALAALICRLFPTLAEDGSDASLRTRSSLECFGDLSRDIGRGGDTLWSLPVRGEQALRLWLDWTADQALRGARTSGDIEALGWLELAMEEAPHLILIGLNEAWLPQNRRANPLLGEEEFGAADTRTRTHFVRDVHALTALVLARAGARESKGLLALSLRRGAGDDPLRPSRLLFHTDDATAVARARTFYPVHTPRAAVRPVEARSKDKQPLFMPLPIKAEIRSVRVTDFKQFLQSPYLHYLQRMLKLERVRDDAWELEALGFGSLVHGVLESFGLSDRKDSLAARPIAEFLSARLKQLASERFGERPLPAVRLQLQQLERRLSQFAQRQAELARDGWRIHQVERKLAGAALEVDGVTVEVHGRVDRIDRHEDGRRWRILDYKTGDDGKAPKKAHLSRNGWLDLQLPLYRQFLLSELAGQIELGYFAIPRTLSDCGVHVANFEPQEFESALDEARRILREMLAGDFARAGRSRPTDRVQRALCGHSLLSLDDDASGDADSDDEEGLE